MYSFATTKVTYLTITSYINKITMPFNNSYKTG